MSDDDWAIQQYRRDVQEAEQERFQQAGFLALSQLQSELPRLATQKQFNDWCERVNKRAQEIMARPN